MSSPKGLTLSLLLNGFLGATCLYFLLDSGRSQDQARSGPSRSRRDTRPSRNDDLAINQEEFFNSLQSRDQKSAHAAVFSGFDEKTSSKQPYTISDAISILNNQYQFDNLASRDDQRDLSRAMQTFETKIMKRFDTLINDFKAGGHNTDNMLKSTKDEVAKVSENFGHIKQTTRMVEDNLSAKIDSEVRKLRDTLSIKFQKEIRNVLTTSRQLKASIEGNKNLFNQLNSEMDYLNSKTDELFNNIDNTKNVLLQKFRGFNQFTRTSNVTNQALVQNQRSIMTRVSRFQGSIQKLHKVGRQDTEEIKREINKNHRDTVPTLTNVHNGLNNVQSSQDMLKNRFNEHFNNLKKSIQTHAISNKDSYDITAKSMRDNFFKLDTKMNKQMDDLSTQQALLNNEQKVMIDSLKLTSDNLYDFTNTTISNVTSLLNQNKAAVTVSVQTIGKNIESAIGDNRKSSEEHLRSIIKMMKDDSHSLRGELAVGFGKDITAIMKLQNLVNEHKGELQQFSTVLTNLKNNVEHAQQVNTQSFGTMGNTVRGVIDKIESVLETKFDALGSDIDSHIQGLNTKADSAAQKTANIKSSVLPRFKTLIDLNKSSNKDLHEISQDLTLLTDKLSEMKSQNVRSQEEVQMQVNKLVLEFKAQVLLLERNFKDEVKQMTENLNGIPETVQSLLFDSGALEASVGSNDINSDNRDQVIELDYSQPIIPEGLLINEYNYDGLDFADKFLISNKTVDMDSLYENIEEIGDGLEEK